VNGYLDDIPTADVPRFQEELRESLRADGSIYKEIVETKDLGDELEGKLKQQVEKFKQGFNVEASDSLVTA
jgi:F-type H+-transporting ATPase subunit alpha